jgi:lipopolysaccharide cholinephosphotransferase
MENQMNEVQQCILNIYKEVAKLCKRHGIDYWGIGGTCIGTVRHHGFIPWDDDMDIAIPIEQIDTFIELAKKELPKHLKVFTPYDSKHNPLFFFKIIDTNTTMIESYFRNFPDMYNGVWLDIFVASGVPDSKWKRKLFFKKGVWLERINKKTSLSYFQEDTLKGKLAWLAFAPLRGLRSGFWWDMRLCDIKKRPLSQSTYGGFACAGCNLEITFRAKSFLEFIEMPFEDTTIPCPKGYDEYLSYQFGNYMEYPSEEDRNSGHDFSNGIIDLHTPYTEYVKKWEKEHCNDGHKRQN